jgi:uncharacterized protein
MTNDQPFHEDAPALESLMKSLSLKLLPHTYAVARLEADARIPDWADGVGFVSISRTDAELSIVCRAERVPAEVRSSPDWACFKLEGPFAFDETGVVLAVIAPLSTAGLGVFVVSTYDGDHVLVKQDDLPRAQELLLTAGHRIA